MGRHVFADLCHLFKLLGEWNLFIDGQLCVVSVAFGKAIRRTAIFMA
jgi:hypothetical protein